MTHIAIQGLGEHPAPLIFLLEKEQPDTSYIITSEYSYDRVDERGGFEKPSGELIEEAGEEAGTEIVFKKCDTFEPSEVGNAMGEILTEIESDDKVTINYTAGSATIKLLLGATAVALSKIIDDLKVVYAIRYPDGEERYLDQTEDLQNLFRSILKIL